MNNNFLDNTIKLLKITSYSGEEQKVATLCKKILKKNGFKVKTDKIGNVYAQRGKNVQFPLLNAHMDSVEDYFYGAKYIKSTSIYDKKIACFYKEECIQTLECADGYDEENELLKYCPECNSYEPEDFYEQNFYSQYNNIDKHNSKKELDKNFELYYNGDTKEITSNNLRPMGGDDKCGIAIALQIAIETKIPMKILFTVQEETGCVGIDSFIDNHKDWFNDIDYSITIDRKGFGDIVYSIGMQNLCTRRFLANFTSSAILNYITPKVVQGGLADALSISNIVKDSVNISCGYYNPHSIDEYVKFDEMIIVKDWIKNFVEGEVK